MERQKKINQLIRLMKQKGIDAYFIPTADFHQSEYISAYFKCREFMSGFTGSAGTMVVFSDGEAGLWTDGRYFIQAEEQLSGSGIQLFKMGEKDVPTIPEYLKKRFPKGLKLGFDGRIVSFRTVKDIKTAFGDNPVEFMLQEDLVGAIWENRPSLSKEPMWLLDEKYAGESFASKKKKVLKKLDEAKADYLVLSSLDDIAWLLNVRGGDVEYNPVFLSYLVIGKEETVLFSQLSCAEKQDKCNLKKVRDVLTKVGVVLKPYEEIYDYVFSLRGIVWLDERRINYRLFQAVPENCKIHWEENPTLLIKACKNPVEVDNVRLAHIKDGVAVTKFIYWLKHLQVNEDGFLVCEDGLVTELYIAEKLEQFRQQGEHYLGQSFDPIAAYGAHGAIVHYSATKESNASIQKKGFLLLDTGGHYLEGTTDITRTICLGEVSAYAKRNFTLVLKGNLKLLNAVFPKGCRGVNLDILARQYLWNEGLDYNHGTGHGVGYLLNVHESPNSFRFRIPENFVNLDSAIMEEGMITSDEPGYYLAGEYGIRHENLIVCVPHKETEYGKFLKFEPLTLVPFDLEGLEMSLLSEEDKNYLNQYHALVYEKISPYLTEDERVWLRDVTREVGVGNP